MEGKRGQQLSFSTIIIAALGLLVLIVIAIIFKESVSKYTKGYTDTAENAINRANEGFCASSVSGQRKCATDDPDGSSGKDEWHVLPEPAGKWKNCNQAQQQKCWEKG